MMKSEEQVPQYVLQHSNVSLSGTFLWGKLASQIPIC